MSAIAEFKKHGVTVDDLKNEINNTKDTYLKSKLLDMSLLYQKFEEKNKRQLYRRNRFINNARKLFRKNRFSKKRVLYI